MARITDRTRYGTKYFNWQKKKLNITTPNILFFLFETVFQSVVHVHFSKDSFELNRHTKNIKRKLERGGSFEWR